MGRIHEVRDPAEARRLIAQGLWLQRLATPGAGTVGPALRQAIEVAAGGEPLPPIGFVADVGHLALDAGRDPRAGRGLPAVPGWPAGLARAYEDLVLGKLDADGSMVRASDALARYKGRDRDRGLAFLLDALRRRAGAGGVLLNPAVLKAAAESPPEEVLASGWDALASEGPMPILVELYEGLVAAVRDAPEALGPEDVFELEHGTALAAFSQRVALRQVVQAAAELQSGLAAERPRAETRRREVASRLMDEDFYPVGGFSSISTRGSIQSLLHSELVYMEPDGGDRPDLFDIKFVRDELLYYARDENQFLRRRRSLLVALFPDLALARCKDAELPRQRIILLLALLVAAVQRLTDWLSDEALHFEFLFLRDGDAEPLAQERALVEMVLREPIAAGTASVAAIAPAELADRAEARARRSLCQLLAASAEDRHVAAEGAEVARLQVAGPRPALGLGDDPAGPVEADDAPASWRAALERLLRLWL